jgi:hypothetical protein
MMMMETSIRDDEHNEDMMVQLMFETLCPLEDEARWRGRRCRRCLTACLKGRSLAAGDNRSKGRRGGSVVDERTTERRTRGYMGDDNAYTHNNTRTIT